MVNSQTILALVKQRINKVLTVAEVGLTDYQFAAFRKVVLDEFGRSGLEKELEQVFKAQDQERQGQE